MNTSASAGRLILASQSPRRRELLQEAGYEFEVVSPSAEAETEPWTHESAEQTVSRLARSKASDVAARRPEAWVIGCDTLALCDGELLGKPADVDDARRMLLVLRDQEHQVLSGLCLMHWSSGWERTVVDATRLYMDAVSDGQLEQYLDSGDWRGKAGAFGYQDGLDWIHIRRGSSSNVIGLPMERLRELLREAGLTDQ